MKNVYIFWGNVLRQIGMLVIAWKGIVFSRQLHMIMLTSIPNIFVKLNG